ncbi:MAG TPA: MBL fold metallo-hydrolase [Ideonella sp.]|uniref:MBL fold metallo-hydrolase n=1 Tax=Ideonella sp. TaxID=1929293 RepID=UPI002E314665|nr:MBL fold metallo-hydrolase [Ideonella sp.]HEX5683420.1 MBL fold metallo-hydrolase [Ideonella sp.]
MAAFNPSPDAATVSRPRNRYYDPTKPHHRPDGFQNNHSDFRPKSLAEVLRWRLNASKQGLPPPPREPIPRTPPDLGFLHANAKAGAGMQPAVTWVGHATVLAQLGGLNVLTDPIFSDRASPVQFAGPRRHHPPGIALKELPRIDVVVASHNHYDHLDEASIQHLNAQDGAPPLFVVPLGLEDWLRSKGVSQALELDWWDSHTIDAPAGAVEVMLLPSRHWSSRSLNDRMQTLWGGFAVMAPDCHLFYAGDTGYSRDFTDIRERLKPRQAGHGFDIALLPIGSYEPRWFMADQHVNVHEAVKIHQDLGARRSLGVHWGTFELTDEALDEPPRQLILERSAAGLAENDFFVLAVGETRRIPRRPPAAPR